MPCREMSSAGGEGEGEEEEKEGNVEEEEEEADADEGEGEGEHDVTATGAKTLGREEKEWLVLRWGACEVDKDEGPTG